MTSFKKRNRHNAEYFNVSVKPVKAHLIYFILT